MTRTESFELIDPQVLRLEGDPARYLGLGLYRDFILVGCALATLQPGRWGFLSQNWAAGSDEIRRRLLPELLAELSAHGRSDLQAVVWPEDGGLLADNGFSRVETIISYYRPEQPGEDWTGPTTIREFRPEDADGYWEVESSAFEPYWQRPIEAVACNLEGRVHSFSWPN